MKELLLKQIKKGKFSVKKALIIISSAILLLAGIVSCLGLYIINTPEYALKTMIDDVNTSGMEGLEPHLTDKAKETIYAVSCVTDSNLFNTIMRFINQNNYVGVLKSEIQEIEWGVDDILKSKENAEAILSFNYEDRLIGTIEILMIRDEGKWKIDGIEFPEFTEVNW